MSWPSSHPRRYERLREIELLHPREHAHRIYRTTALLEFPWDVRIGLNLAFYRTFTSPRIARLLDITGEINRNPQKRSMDTGLLMYELIDNGLDHSRGRQVIRMLNRMHHRWQINNEDYLYVLSTFVVTPTRWVDAHGWRRLSSVEREAAAAFYHQLGRMMSIRDLPDDYAGFEGVFDSYEQAHVAYSDAGARLIRATRTVLAERLPPGAPWIADRLNAVLLGPRLARAVGLRPALRSTQVLVNFVLCGRAAAVRRLPPRDTSWFTPGRQTSVYPAGYSLDQLGVEKTNSPST